MINLNKLLNAINEGLKTSLLDFGNQPILKSQYIDNGISVLIDKINKWLDDEDFMDHNLYNELCKKSNIGIYTVNDLNTLLNIVAKSIKYIDLDTEDLINLNWIDVSEINDEIIFKELNNIIYRNSIIYSLNIQDWDLKNDNIYFGDCEHLKTILLPNNMLNITWSAFYDCKRLQSIILPTSVNEIKRNTFYNCENLVSVKLPNGLLKIDDNAFEYCSSLRKIIMPDSVNYIGHSVFAECGSLQLVMLSKSISMIKHSTFSGCNELLSITIPASIKTIDGPFDGCKNLKKIKYLGTMEQWDVIDIAFSGITVKKVECIDGTLENVKV